MQGQSQQLRQSGAPFSLARFAFFGFGPELCRSARLEAGALALRGAAARRCPRRTHSPAAAACALPASSIGALPPRPQQHPTQRQPSPQHRPAATSARARAHPDSALIYSTQVEPIPLPRYCTILFLCERRTLEFAPAVAQALRRLRNHRRRATRRDTPHTTTPHTINAARRAARTPTRRAPHRIAPRACRRANRPPPLHQPESASCMAAARAGTGPWRRNAATAPQRGVSRRASTPAPLPPSPPTAHTTAASVRTVHRNTD
jgi:hypothetical protein